MKTVLKPCSLAEAVTHALTGETYIIMRIDEDTTVADLDRATGYMISVPAEEPKPEPKPQPKPKAVAKKPAPKQPALDHGKIMALHRAGWSTAKIADEMGCTAQTIRNHIAEDSNESGKDTQQGTK